MNTGRALSLCIGCQQDLPLIPHKSTASLKAPEAPGLNTVMDLPILTENCQKCALFLPPKKREMGYCEACLASARPFDRIFALFSYEFPVTYLIQALKFNQQLYLARLFGELLCERITSTWYKGRTWPNLIIPVPLHPHRLRERGYNQALEIARPIAKRLHLPLDIRGIKRIKHTEKQSSLDKEARAENILGAFATMRDYTGMHIAILDDVITTGSTVSELSSVLRTAGASQIDVWCCGRR